MPAETVARLLTRVIGLDPESLGLKVLSGIVARRLAAVGCPDEATYVRHLGRDRAEFERLIEEVVVPETWFFRDQGPFELVAELARQRRAAAETRPWRLLSASCATGEEPYSLAMTLLEAGLAPEAFVIEAADLSARALAAAARGHYRARSFRGISAPPAWFAPASDGFRLDPAVTRLVRFRQANLLSPDFFREEPSFDLVFCRNVLIYLTAEAKSRVLATLVRLLAPGGLLFVGHSEVPLIQASGFAPVPRPMCFACARLERPEASPKTDLRPASAPARPARRPAKRTQPERRPPPVPPAPHVPPAAAPEPAPDLEDAKRLADAGRLDEAAACCRAILGVQPELAPAWQLLGCVLSCQERTLEAVEALRKALYLAPGDAEALSLLALLFERLGEPEQATACRNRAERLGMTADGGGA